MFDSRSLPDYTGSVLLSTDKRTGVRNIMNRTKVLLACGIAAGPLYVAVGTVEALTRRGFNPLRDDLSLLSNGRLGWIQIALFILAGALTLLGARGSRRAMSTGKGGTWAPRFLGLYGFGLIAAGIFTADPAMGFPPGTPADAHSVSWHGMLHLVSGAIGFIGLVAACLTFARRFAERKEGGWAAFAVVTAIVFFASFIGVAVGSQQGGAALTVEVLAFTFGVVLSWAWITSVLAKLTAETAG